jgi:hypothetical protein
MKTRFPQRSAEQIRAKLYASCSLPEFYKKHIQTQKRSRAGYKGDFHHEVGFGVPDAKLALTEQDPRHTAPRDELDTVPPDTDPQSTDPSSTDPQSTDPSPDREGPMPEAWKCTEFLDPVAEDPPYNHAFKYCVRPLSAFLNALTSAGGVWQEMLHDFWKDPFVTARKAGVPWQACIALAEFDRDEIDRLVDIEIGRHEGASKDYYDKEGGGSGGPIGVKLT